MDSRFKYDAVTALGVSDMFSGLMSSYDKMVGGPQAEQIWDAFIKAVGLDPSTVKQDVEEASKYASGTSPATILQHMEGGGAGNKKVGEAFESIGNSLYSIQFSVGLFKIMELSGVEVTKSNVEEWAKALKITPLTKVTGDLDVYKQNRKKLQMVEEMMREVEIREKKKLAERLEEKAKALAAKAAAKTAAAKGDEKKE